MSWFHKVFKAFHNVSKCTKYFKNKIILNKKWRKKIITPSSAEAAEVFWSSS